MNTIWMIRNDGKAFPCSQYIGANSQTIGDTLLTAEWLHTNTQHEESRKLVLKTVAAWIASSSVDSDAISDVPDFLLQKPNCTLSHEFIITHTEEIKTIITDITGKLDLAALCNAVTAELNQEFLQTRYGGMNQTVTSSKELCFCISSVGFDWYKIMRHFIVSANFSIEYIIIIRDKEDIDADSQFYLRLPTETFLAEQPMQLISSGKLKGGVMVREIFSHLSCGNSLHHISEDLAIDPSELTHALTIIRDWENRSPME